MISDLKSLSKSTRIIFLVLFSMMLFLTTRIIAGQWLPRKEDVIWFQYGLLFIVLGSFFLEVHFSRPTDVIANSIAVIVTLFTVDTSTTFLWTVLEYLSWFLLIGSIVTMALSNRSKSEASLQNRIARIFYEIVTFLGQGRLLFSFAFGLSILSLYMTNQPHFIILSAFWAFIMIVGHSGLANLVDRLIGTFSGSYDDLGTVTAFCEPNLVMFKLNQDKEIKKFNLVSIDFGEKNVQRLAGIVINEYLLENEKWAKAISLGPYELKADKDELQRSDSLLFKKGTVRKISEEEISPKVKDEYIWKNRKNIVGIVSENSHIKKIEFEVTPHSNIEELEEGRLLKCIIGEEEVLYQIINAVIKSETLEGKDEAGYTRGVAQQLGIWNKKTCEFRKFGWVPNLNSLLFLVGKEEKVEYHLDPGKNEIILGIIPKSKYPIICDTDTLISHHTGILGITGSGKSWLAYTLIKQFVDNKIKVICVDFTLEYKKDLKKLNPGLFFSKEDTQRINSILDGIEMYKNSDRPYKAGIDSVKKEIDKNIMNFMDGEEKRHLGIFELPDISNSFSILEFTQLFLERVLDYAKNNRDKHRICIVLEEAHTVIPEQATLGVGGDFGRTKGIVGKISQLALQGRKYSVGFLIIAQRTANVSKTVLNQCNSIIAFNAFDKTGLEFMKNYVGEDMANAIPNLKDLEVIITGKAFKARTPMIMKLEEKEKPIS